LFGMGMGICWLYQRGRINHPAVLTAAGTGLFFTMWGILAYNYGLASDPTCRLLAGSGAALAIAGLVGLEVRSGFSVPRPLILLGEASYAIYLIHLPAISAFGRVAVWFRDQIPAPVLMLIVAAAALAIGLIYHIWIERPLMRFINGLGKPHQPVVNL
jgi:exopolysaccharide production protein ExoZ